MPNDWIGLRVELTEDIQMHAAGERGVVGEKGGYIGIVFDSEPKALVICHAKMPITNYVCVVEDEREPEPVQLSLFGGWKID